MLSKIVLNRNDKFFLIGERRSQVYYSKGFALSIRKHNGQRDGDLASPDSVAFQRSHVLLGGIMDNDNRLIALGNTNDFDTLTYSSTYFKGFAMRFGIQQPGCDRPGAEAIVSENADDVPVTASISVYPNPASNTLNISHLEPGVNNHLTVYNMQGVPVLRMNTSAGSARLEVNKLSAGAYILRVQFAGSGKEQNISFIIRR